jgi:hypothetical protein
VTLPRNSHTYFVDLELLQNAHAKKLIRKAISSYQGLKNEERERYLNERMSVRKCDGSAFIELKGQKEVFAKRDLTEWETLGHYGGTQYTEDTYTTNVNCFSVVS